MSQALSRVEGLNAEPWQAGRGTTCRLGSDAEVTQHVADIPHERDDGWMLFLEVFDGGREAFAEVDVLVCVIGIICCAQKALDIGLKGAQEVLFPVAQRLHLLQFAVQVPQILPQFALFLHGKAHSLNSQ